MLPGAAPMETPRGQRPAPKLSGAMNGISVPDSIANSPAVIAAR